MRREYRGAAGRSGIGALVVALLAACVTIAPTPTGTPRPTPAAVISGPTASPTAPPSATPASSPGSSDVPAPTDGGPATPPPSIEPGLAAQIDAVTAQVPAIRGLEPLADVPYELISPEQFRAELEELAFSSVPPERLEAEERLLKRLGLLPDDADLRQLILDLYGASTSAYYRDDTKRFYVIERNAEFGPWERAVVAHEYTHALQDQHFDLEGSRIKDLSEGDAALGQLAAVEGDAMLVMTSWMAENLTIEEQVELVFMSFGQLDDPALVAAPPILRRQLEFPYLEGMAFAQSNYDLGGYAAVDATLSDAIPASTEQILHPEKYRANEEPVEVSLPDIAADVGEGWTNVYEQTMGELIMQVWAAGDEAPTQVIPGFPVEWPHTETVDGWGGDRLAMYEGPDDAWLIDWVVAWDTPGDAAEFAGRANELIGRSDGVARVQQVTTDDLPANRVHVRIASDEALLGT